MSGSFNKARTEAILKVCEGCPSFTGVLGSVDGNTDTDESSKT